VENEESLKTGTIVGEPSDLFKHRVDEFFANGVVASGI
jgi:hypothetical protein